MIRAVMWNALMWKEYREHRAIWLTMSLVGGAGLYGLSRLLGPTWGLGYNSSHESLQSVAVLFAWAYGLICGAMLLANEQESGTMTFLDMLPVRRLELWLVKCLFGLLLLVAQVAVLIGFVVGLGITTTTGQLLATLLAMLVFGAFAMSWSLLFSARGENVLNVIGLSFAGQIAGALATLILLIPVDIVLALVLRGDEALHKLVLVCLGALGLTVGPILGSARLFTRLDRQRRGRLRLSANPQAPQAVWASWGRLLWLSYTQMRRLLIGLMFFSLVLGFLLPALGPVGWPALTLLLGVLCGVTVWSDEQLSAAFRFLGDQRFPLGRVWIVKVGLRFALVVLAAFVLLLPSLVLAMIHRVEASSLGERVPFFSDLLHCSLVGPIVPVGTHLALWLLYGFTVGQLSGLLFRKSLVAGVLALGMAGLLVSLWVPSLLGMGLHFWQVAGVPLILLLAGWLLMPAWAADRLLARGTFVRLGAALLAVGLWIGGGLWYRVAEIPDVPDQLDMPAFAASIPSLDNDEAGREIRGAWGQVDKLMPQLVDQRRIGKPLFPKLRAGNAQDTFEKEIEAVLRRGWPNGSSELGDWLDKTFQQEWFGRLATVPDLPLGVVEDARQLTFDTRRQKWADLVYLNRMLAARGLQQQAHGDPQAFVDNLRLSLTLSRSLQHLAPWDAALAGRRGELIGVAALDRWLEKLPNEAALLKRTLDILLQHEAGRPDGLDTVKAEYLIAQNSLEFVPDKLMDRQIRAHGNPQRDNPELYQAELSATALFWRVPWEHQRHQRILRVAFQGDPRQRHEARKWGGVALVNLVPRLRPRDNRDIALLHAAQLKVAVRLYQAENQGRLPATLNDLVPRYLANLPVDPFDGRPLRYRISTGEPLVWLDDAPVPAHPAQAGMGPPAVPPQEMPAAVAKAPAGQHVELPKMPPLKAVPAGQAILWAVGEDRHDDGGKRQGLHLTNTSFGEDLLYLVPPPR